MPQSILTNTPAFTARRYVNQNSKELEIKQQILASGSIVSDPSNAPSNAAIAERMKAQQNGSGAASQNAAQASSMFQLAAGTLANILEQTQRMRTLAVMSSNGLYSTTDQSTLNVEFKGLAQEIGREIGSTKFNGIGIFSATTGVGSASTFKPSLQVGANTTDQIYITDDGTSAGNAIMDLFTIFTAGIGSDLETITAAVDTSTNATAAITSLDTFIDSVTQVIGNIGAAKAKMDVVEKNLAIFQENNAAAISVISDADIPSELSAAQSLQSLVEVSSTILRSTGDNQKRLAELIQTSLR